MADHCPGNLSFHRAQDGWLARVRVPGGRLTMDQLGALARAAALGNGLVDLTSRANLQLRGLPSDAGDELAAIVRTAGLLPSPAHDRVRNVIASPLAGRHPRSCTGTDEVVAGIDRELCADPALAELPGRFLFAVDDGSGLALDRVADVALIAHDECSYTLVLAEQATKDPLDRADAAWAAVAAARAFLAERRARGTEAWRIGELEDGAAAVAGRLGTMIEGPALQDHRPLSPGRLTQRDGRVALTALAPLGRLDGRALMALAQLTAEIRMGTGRTVTVVDVDPAAAETAHAGLASLGLALRADSGWVGLTACAGLERCPKARIDVLAAAATRSRSRGPAAPAEHWAACERRCGELTGQPVSVAPAAARAGIAVRAGKHERLVGSLEQALAALGS